MFKKLFARTKKGFDVQKAVVAGLKISAPFTGAVEVAGDNQTIDVIGVPIPVSVITGLATQLVSMFFGWLKHRA